MDGRYIFTPNLLPQIFTVIFLMILIIYSSLRRNVPGALPFAIGCLFSALWVSGSIMEYAAMDLETKIFWVKFQAVWQLPATTTITFFIFEYVWPGRWLTGRNVVLLSIAPLLYLILILTNDRYHLLWSGFAFDGVLYPLRSPGIWFFMAYSYFLALLQITLLIWLFRRSPSHRWPVAIILAGEIGARVIFGLQTVIIGQSGLPLDVLAIAFVFLMYAIALFAFHIFDPVPLASQMAIQQLQAGVLVLDPQRRVASMNPAAEQILRVPTSRAMGRPISELLPANVQGHLADSKEVEIELSLGPEPPVRDYTLAISRLRDWRGMEVGRLLLLHNVTEQKRAQGQIIEQQRALAMMQEREHLARELHDSIGQVLGYVGFQVEAFPKLILDGQAEVAIKQLKRLGDIVRDAHADVRAQILDLRTATAGQKPFFDTLRGYLEGFTGNYGIQTQLSVDGAAGEVHVPLDDQMQLLRIIQEALANARKHSQARCVQLAFVTEEPFMRLIIEDDGIGFDPGQPATASNGHFGLHFMRERAEALGGRLWMESAPGAGTRIVVEIPAKEY